MHLIQKGELQTEQDKEKFAYDLVHWFFSCKQKDINNADRYELWVSDFNEADDDFNEIRLFKNDFVVKQIKQQGY